MGVSDLWPHQMRVFELLMAGRNVILRTPTGSGKTRAALYPFLVSLDPTANSQYGKLPPKCIYSVPMRILAKQFFHEYDAIINRYNLRYGLRITRSIQTGEQPDDPRFEADLIFATIDQVLSSFLVAPYSLSKSQANLNAGAIMSSYLVFDEFHLFDPVSTLPTTLQMLNLLKGITPFVLMTATFSQAMLNALAAQLDAVIVPHPDDEAAQSAILNLPSQQKVRRYHTIDAPMDADKILSMHRDRTLVICNTVDRARHVYEQLIGRAEGSETRVLLLHSRFLPEDRAQTEGLIRHHFDREWQTKGGSFIVVSTQAIEVGLDITSSTLHTELAPANAIIQRAGRCARYAGDEGDVYIYSRAIDRNGEEILLSEKPAPYTDQGTELSSTLSAFKGRQGKALNFGDEQATLSTVHEARDRQIVEELTSDAPRHRERMFAVMRGSPTQDARHLIRDVASQRVTIHANPNAALREAPFDAPAFGLHPGTVKGHIKDWLERANVLDLPGDTLWILHDHGDEPDSRDERYCFVSVTEPETAYGAPLLVIHPALAGYDEKLGFMADRGGAWQALLPDRGNRKAHFPRRYRKETYERHIELVYAAFNEFWPEAEYAASRLESRYGWQSGSVRQAAELAVLLHDVGKLSEGWQQWAHAYQQAVADADSVEYAPHRDEAYAHTTVDGDRYREIERSIRPTRPWHAVEGAAASMPVISTQFGGNHPLVQTVFSAIARHHSAFAETGQAYRLIPNAKDHVFSMLVNSSKEVLLEQMNSSGIQKAKNLIVQPQHSQQRAAYLAYLLIVRALRRSDGEGTRRGVFYAE